MSADWLQDLEHRFDACDLEQATSSACGRRPAAEALAMELWRQRHNLMACARTVAEISMPGAGAVTEPAETQDFPLLDLMERRA